MNSSIYFRAFATLLLITALILAPHAARSQQQQTASPPKQQATTPQSTPRQAAPKQNPPQATPTPAPAPPVAPGAPKSVERSPAQDAPPQSSSAKDARETDSIRFEKLLADESFMVVGEMRALNQYLQSPLVKETLALYSQLGETPKEMRLLLDLIARNGDALDSARISFAMMPMRPNLPQMLFGVQFADERTARDLTPQLRRLIPALAAAASPKLPVEEPKKSIEVKPAATPPAANPAAAERGKKDEGYFVKQIGGLLLLSEKEFKIEDLKPSTSALSLDENPRYQQVQAQFGSESGVVFYDLKLAEREIQRVVKEQQALAERARAVAKAKPAEGEPLTDLTGSDDDAPPIPDEEMETTIEVPTSPSSKTEEMSEEADPQEGVMPADDSMSGAVSGTSVAIPSLGMILPNIFGGGGGLTQMLGGAEALGIGFALNSDAASIRLLFATPDKKNINPIPFLPMVIAGAPASPRAAAMLPADTDVFVSMSLNLAQTYDQVLGVADNVMRMRTGNEATLTDKPNNAQLSTTQTGDVKTDQTDATPQISPAGLAVAMIEQRYGFKIKDELIASLGSEVALGMLHSKPSEAKDANAKVTSTSETPAKEAAASVTETKNEEATRASNAPGFVVLISVSDRERLKRLLPLALEAAGMRLPNVGNFAFQKRGDAEFITFALGSAAFIGDYLVIAPDAPTLDRIIEIAAGGSSLAANPEFVAARAWQPREKLAELFVTGNIIESFLAGERQQLIAFDENIKTFFDAHHSAPEPLSYVLTGDPQGTFHELRIPRSAILSFASQAAADAKHGEKVRNERYANYRLTALAAAQASFRNKEKRYGTLDELRTAELIWETELSSNGYTLRLNVSADKFDATTTPNEYNVTGRRSFYIDDTGNLRAADHGGRPATAADPEAK